MADAGFSRRPPSRLGLPIALRMDQRQAGFSGPGRAGSLHEQLNARGSISCAKVIDRLSEVAMTDRSRVSPDFRVFLSAVASRARKTYSSRRLNSPPDKLHQARAREGDDRHMLTRSKLMRTALVLIVVACIAVPAGGAARERLWRAEPRSPRAWCSPAIS